jgi:hypothetical protein
MHFGPGARFLWVSGSGVTALLCGFFGDGFRGRDFSGFGWFRADFGSFAGNCEIFRNESKNKDTNGTILGDFGWISGATIPEVPDIILAF